VNTAVSTKPLVTLDSLVRKRVSDVLAVGRVRVRPRGGRVAAQGSACTANGATRAGHGLRSGTSRALAGGYSRRDLGRDLKRRAVGDADRLLSADL